VHCFGDGILIASAFMADLRLGVIASLAVLAHEVPHHMGDLVVLRGGSGNRRMALVKVSLAGAVTALGGTLGYFLVERLQDYLPYFLAVASSSFIYVALADLIPAAAKTPVSARNHRADCLAGSGHRAGDAGQRAGACALNRVHHRPLAHHPV
jgi:zinc and cadmium transporter